MTDTPFRALVVDDEAVARRAVMWALANEGFECEPAIDGIDALHKFRQKQYDLIVIDLVMPNKHGHALSVEILANLPDPKPVLVVHSGVNNPRLTKDLLIRGIDDFISKPANYEAFAAKMKAIVWRRRRLEDQRAVKSDGEAAHEEQEEQAVEEFSALKDHGPLKLGEFDERLNQIKHILPVSDTAIDILKHVNSDRCDATVLANIVGRDAVFAAELLRMANTSAYNRSGRRIVQVSEAIARVGIKRIGELALAVSALGGLTNVVLPWFDKDLARQRSLAAALAADAILRNHKMSAENHGVMFCAMMYPLGRIVTGTAYANIYESILAESHLTERSLFSLEQELFPRTASSAVAHVLTRWGIPADVCTPLVYADTPFQHLDRLNKAIRKSVLLLKTAVLLGELAVGQWMPWDHISFPSNLQLRDVGLSAPLEIVEKVREQVSKEMELAGNGAVKTCNKGDKSAIAPIQVLSYCNLALEVGELLPRLLESMNFQLQHISSDDECVEADVLINCQHTPISRLASKAGGAARRNWVMLTSEQYPPSCQWMGKFVQLPTSYRAIRAACEQIVTLKPHTSENAQSCEDRETSKSETYQPLNANA